MGKGEGLIVEGEKARKSRSFHPKIGDIIISTEPSMALDVILVEELKQMVDAHSKYAKRFRQIRDHVERGESYQHYEADIDPK
ncbi:DNA helicase [Trifolium repens]|nr:DNA helicase [Trifolium repens]